MNCNNEVLTCVGHDIEIFHSKTLLSCFDRTLSIPVRFFEIKVFISDWGGKVVKRLPKSLPLPQHRWDVSLVCVRLFVDWVNILILSFSVVFSSNFFSTYAYSLRFLAMKALNYNCRAFLNIIWIWRWGELVPWDTCKLSLKLIPGIYQGEKRNYSEVFHEKLEGLH